MQSVVPMIQLDLGLKRPPLLFATDAMGASERDHGGYGVVGTPASAAEIDDVYQRARQLSYTVPRVDGDLSGLRRPERVLVRTVPATTLSVQLFTPGRWLSIDRGRWASADHITLGEGRAVVRLTRRLAAAAAWHNTFVISLQDNQPICGAFTKGRSPAWHLLRLCRQKAASVLAANLRLLLPWVQTSLQPADYDSRLD